MNKKYNLKLDLQFRCNNSTMKFNQFDNNTSDFFMRITNGGKLVDIEKAIVVLATIKPSGKVSSQFVEVKNGLVYADLKPNMKDEIGTYTAKAMLILEDERVVTDPINYEVEEDKIFGLLNDTMEATEEFTLLTDMLSRLSNIEISEEQRVINEAERILSEENRKIEEAKRVEAELIRQHEEADRAKYDAIRESNENTRKQNESIRLANEANRIDEEAKRVEEEAKRKLAEEERNANYNFMTEDEERRRSEANTHKEAEVLRVQAETNRVNEESKRRTTEQARVSAENIRVGNENTRVGNEVTRQNNEAKRVEAETQRQNRYNSFIIDAEANANNFENYTNSAKVKEEERKSNELDRKTQEDRRISNEVERISNENTRKANEVIREENEASRQDVFENKVSEVDEKISEINTTKDNFISSINTKIDNKISEIDKSKSDMANTVSNKINDVETRFNRLTSSQQQDAEVIDARVGENGKSYAKLGDRLDEVDSQLEQNESLIGDDGTLSNLDRSIFLSKKEMFINVKDYGAKGDGVTDDSEAFKLAFSKGNQIIIPAGKYIVSNIEINEPKVIKGLTSSFAWRTQEQYQTELINISKNDMFINAHWNDGGNSLSFENIIFKGNGDNNCIRARWDLSLTNCTFENFATAVYDIHGGIVDKCKFWQNKTGLSQLTDVKVTNCDISMNDVGIDLSNGNSNHITNNRIEWNKISGIKHYKGVYNTVNNNQFDRNQVGFDINSSTDIIIVGNRFDRSIDYHIKLKCNRVNITGNVFVKRDITDQNSGTSKPDRAIKLISYENVTFVGNDCNTKIFDDTSIEYSGGYFICEGNYSPELFRSKTFTFNSSGKQYINMSDISSGYSTANGWSYEFDVYVLTGNVVRYIDYIVDKYNGIAVDIPDTEDSSYIVVVKNKRLLQPRVI